MAAKQWGPFSGRQLTTIICIIGGLALFPIGAAAVVTGSSVFPTDAVTGKHAQVDASGALRTWALPANSFTLGPQQGFAAPTGSSFVKPLPSGSRFAITQFSVSNSGGAATTVQLHVYGMNDAIANCGPISNVVDSDIGPIITVGAASTQTLTFPTPYITRRITGSYVCLAPAANGLAGMTWTATGYVLLP